jgi:hypothetical protein
MFFFPFFGSSSFLLGQDDPLLQKADRHEAQPDPDLTRETICTKQHMKVPLQIPARIHVNTYPP